jgi:Fe-S oxidoreductase
MSEQKMPVKVPTMAECISRGEVPEILFWVGCSGSFDDRAKKITKAIVKILNHVGINFAVLGTEESCTGDPAKRAGNEFLFQMQAMNNISVLNGYEIKKIVTGCPHCFNTLKNEYPALGGTYEVIHHTQLIQGLINEGINIDPLSIIVDLRRYLVMEQSAAPGELNNMFTNIENNGAPWQFSPSDRLNWKDEA